MNDKDIVPLFVDNHLDDILSATFGRKHSPQLFFVDNNTEMVYANEFDVPGDEIVSWVLNGTYKKTNTSFPIPRTLPWQLYLWYKKREMYKTIFHALIGNYVNYFIHFYVP